MRCLFSMVTTLQTAVMTCFRPNRQQTAAGFELLAVSCVAGQSQSSAGPTLRRRRADRVTSYDRYGQGLARAYTVSVGPWL